MEIGTPKIPEDQRPATSAALGQAARPVTVARYAVIAASPCVLRFASKAAHGCDWHDAATSPASKLPTGARLSVTPNLFPIVSRTICRVHNPKSNPYSGHGHQAKGAHTM